VGAGPAGLDTDGDLGRVLLSISILVEVPGVPEWLLCGEPSVGPGRGTLLRPAGAILVGVGPAGLDTDGDLGRVLLSISILVEVPGVPERLLCGEPTVGPGRGMLLRPAGAILVGARAAGLPAIGDLGSFTLFGAIPFETPEEGLAGPWDSSFSR